MLFYKNYTCTGSPINFASYHSLWTFAKKLISGKSSYLFESFEASTRETPYPDTILLVLGLFQTLFYCRAKLARLKLDCSTTLARLGFTRRLNSVEKNSCCQKQNTKIKERFRKLLNLFLCICNLWIEFGTVAARRLKPSRGTSVYGGKAFRSVLHGGSTDLVSNVALWYTAVVKSNLIRSI